MGINIRHKGQIGEREVCAILVEQGLCIEASRELDQVRIGGSDVEALTHMSIEVKRHEKVAVKTYWDQVMKSAAAVGKCPCVWWRPNRKAWLVMLPAGAIPKSDLANSILQCGKIIPKNYPHLQFVHYKDFCNWYKAKYVVNKVA